MRKEFLIIVLILLFGGFLRLVALDNESLWLDEGYSLRAIISEDFWGVIKYDEGTPFLYFAFMRGWTGLFGFSEFWLRLPSVIFDLLSVVVIFFLGRKLFDVKTGLLVAGLTAVSPVNILFSQEARPYSMALFLVITSTLFLVKTVKKEGKMNRLFYVIFASLMLFTHNLALFVFAGQIIYAFKNQLKIRHLAWILFTVFAIYLPNIPYLIGQLGHVNMSLGYTLPNKLGLPSFVGGLGAWNFLIIFVVGLILLRYFWRILTGRIVLAASLPWLFFNTAPNFLVRYAFFLTPFLYLGVVRPIAGWSRKVLFGLVLVFIIMSLSLFYTTEPRKEDWRGAADFLAEQEPLPIILVNPHTRYPLYYYLEGRTEAQIVYFDSRKIPRIPYDEFFLLESHGESFEHEYDMEDEIIRFKDIKVNHHSLNPK